MEGNNNYASFKTIGRIKEYTTHYMKVNDGQETGIVIEGYKDKTISIDSTAKKCIIKLKFKDLLIWLINLKDILLPKVIFLIG